MIYKGEEIRKVDWGRRMHLAPKVKFYARIVDRIQVSSALNEEEEVRQLFLLYYAIVGQAPFDTNAARRLPPLKQGDKV